MDTIDARPRMAGQVSVVITKEQASALIAVLACVGGDPADTRRGLVQPIFDALMEVKGVSYCTDDIKGSPGACLQFLAGPQ